MKLGVPAKDLIPEGLPRLRKLGRMRKKQRADRSGDPDAPLTMQEQAFIWNIAEKNLPIPVAYAEAGFASSVSNAHFKLKQPKMVKALDEARAKLENLAHMTRKRVLDGFLESINVAKLAGEPIAMVAGWREVARMCGYYEADKRKIEISVNGQLQLEKLQAIPREQLMAIVEGREFEGEFRELAAGEVGNTEVKDAGAPEIDRKLDPAA